jgi:hypothetical protein
MKKITALSILCFFILSGMAIAGQKTQSLSIFPWNLSTKNVPLYPENFGQLCTTDIVDSQCQVNVGAGTLATKEVPYSGSKPFSGEVDYEGMLPVAASGTVPFNTHDKVGTGTFTYAVSAPTCGPGNEKGCCTAKGNPDDGSVTLVCQRINPEDLLANQAFSYDICQAKTVSVPWSYSGLGRVTGKIPYSGSVAYSGVTSCSYTEYAATDVLYNEGNVVLDCPDPGEVPTQEVAFRELVTNAYVGDHIEIEATGWTPVEKTVTSRIMVKYAEPSGGGYTTVLKTDKIQTVANGIFKISLDGGFTFTKAGTYQIQFKVGGAGATKTRMIAVEEAPQAQ